MAIFIVTGIAVGASWLLYHFSGSSQHLVAVIPATTAEELWESEHAGIADTTRGTPWKVYWNGPDDLQDVAQQIILLRKVEAMRPSGLILTPDHSLALNSEVTRILELHIPTVILSTGLTLDPTDRLRFVLNDDAAAAKLAADYVGQLLREHGTVAVIGDDPDISSASSRATLLAASLHADHPGVSIIAQPRGTLRFGEAEQQIQDIIQDHPDLNAIISIGILETRTAVATLRGLKRRDNVALIGLDQDLDLMYELRHGGVNAIIAQNTYRMGAIAMNMVMRPESMKLQPPVIRISPVLVTPANIDTAEVQRVLSMDWRHRS